MLEAQERARDVVRHHRDKLDAMAARLLTAEVVEEEEMTRLWGPKVSRPGTIREPRPHRGAARTTRPSGRDGGGAPRRLGPPQAVAGHDLARRR